MLIKVMAKTIKNHERNDHGLIRFDYNVRRYNKKTMARKKGVPNNLTALHKQNIGNYIEKNEKKFEHAMNRLYKDNPVAFVQAINQMRKFIVATPLSIEIKPPPPEVIVIAPEIPNHLIQEAEVVDDGAKD